MNNNFKTTGVKYGCLKSDTDDKKYFTQKYNSVQNTFVPVLTFSSETSSKFFHSFFNKFCTSGCSIKTSSTFSSALYYLKRNYGNEVLL